MRLLLAILIGKIIFSLVRFLRIGGGSAAPGLYALKIEPNLVSKLAGQIPQNVVITGTNGKTTTARMLEHFAKSNDFKTVRNHTGSNLERGIASTLISKSSLLGDSKNYDLGIWELDEAAFNSVILKLDPKIVIFLNVFRDQLDRYGEIDTVVKRWAETVSKLKSDTLIIYNSDDENLKKVIKSFPGSSQSFGVKDYKILGESIERSAREKNVDFEAKDIKVRGLAGSSFRLTINDLRFTILLQIPGIYHIYDLVAAFAAGYNLNLDVKKMVSSLAHYSPAFGRVEKLKIEGKEAWIFLIKNPAGATQVFETITPEIKPDDRLLVALNDNLADGTDVSWIWDANFEKLITNHQPPIIIASGTRAQDLAVRLKYAGFDPGSILIENNLKRALKVAKQDLKGRLLILPTYTALLELQAQLAKMGVKSHYWKE